VPEQFIVVSSTVFSEALTCGHVSTRAVSLPVVCGRLEHCASALAGCRPHGHKLPLFNNNNNNINIIIIIIISYCNWVFTRWQQPYTSTDTTIQ
jgi:hypothetical protein